MWLEVGGKCKEDNIIKKQFHENFVLSPLDFRELSHSSEMENDALTHRDGF